MLIPATSAINSRLHSNGIRVGRVAGSSARAPSAPASPAPCRLDAILNAIRNQPFPEDPGVSSYWRKNTSSSEATELANLLRALRKVAGHIGPNAGRIEYTGMSVGNSEALILVDPSLVMGRYPVPAARVDYVVGLTVHECLHNVEFSDHVWKLLESDMAAMRPRERITFQKMVRIGEDIHVDTKAAATVFGLYTRVARTQALKEDRIGFDARSVSVDGLMYCWWNNAFQDLPENDPLPEYVPLLEHLDTLTVRLRDHVLLIKGVIRRCEERVNRYRETWKTLGPRISTWKIFDKHLFHFETGTPATARIAATAPASAGHRNLPPMLARRIEADLAARSTDITPMIRAIVGYDDETVASMSRWDYNIPAHPVIDRRMVGRLKAIFQNYADRRRIVSRGLAAGRIDARRLYRAPADGRCFKQIERLPNLDWNVVLLMDASGSMRGGKWRMVENTVANIHAALAEQRNRLKAYAYFEADKMAMISQLIVGDRLLSIPPSGQTASGQAIIAAGCMMPKDRSRNLMIHVTDGECNFGCDVARGIEFCDREGIHLVTLGCGVQDRAILERQYGRTIQFIDQFSQLPRAMENLFKWIFLSILRNRSPFQETAGRGSRGIELDPQGHGAP